MSNPFTMWLRFFNNVQGWFFHWTGNVSYTPVAVQHQTIINIGLSEVVKHPELKQVVARAYWTLCDEIEHAGRDCDPAVAQAARKCKRGIQARTQKKGLGAEHHAFVKNNVEPVKGGGSHL